MCRITLYFSWKHYSQHTYQRHFRDCCLEGHDNRPVECVWMSPSLLYISPLNIVISSHCQISEFKFHCPPKHCCTRLFVYKSAYLHCYCLFFSKACLLASKVRIQMSTLRSMWKRSLPENTTKIQNITKHQIVPCLILSYRKSWHYSSWFQEAEEKIQRQIEKMKMHIIILCEKWTVPSVAHEWDIEEIVDSKGLPGRIWIEDWVGFRGRKTSLSSLLSYLLWGP